MLNETVQYNSVGNISRIENSTGGTSVEYTYDSQGQLLTATHRSGSTVTRTETYSYDGVGNLQSFSNGSRSHTYTYGDGDWKDLLTAVDGQTITYDGAGNPLSYYDGYRYTMTWSEGRRLASLTYANKTTRYEYNADGIRTKKFNADGTYVVYHLADGRAIGETVYAADGSVVRYMRYAFDENDSVVGFSLWSGGWQHYYFVKNLQGDVVKVYKASDNSLVASYTYDSWGNVLSATGELATINPFRYRGYYYDNESWFYYLQSRYYDPAIGRFINADVFTSTGQGFIGCNMFAYCNNNPVLYSDSAGTWPSLSQICAAVAAVAAVVATVAACVAAAPVAITVLGTAISSSAATTVAATAIAVAETATAAAVVTQKVEQVPKSYSIYTLSDADGNVQYVGRTCNYRQRMAAHRLNPARKDLIPHELHTGLDYGQARAVEQAYILYYTTLDRTDPAKNQINGVNPRRNDYESIMKKGFGLDNALDSFLTNSVLCMFE